jgi:hypothetical protein
MGDPVQTTTVPGLPVQTIPNLPPAIAVAGPEQLWINQAGVDRRTTLSAVAALVKLPPIVGGGSGMPSISDYATLRSVSFDPSVTSILLDDIYKGGIFVRGPASLPDNGGTRIRDASGQFWWRVYDERINAAWFYSGPPDTLGNPTTLGSGPAQITAADQAANPQWVGLADDGYGGGPGSVQIAQPYPVGTYWDFVALQEWIYACAAERSVPPSTFVGAMLNDGRVHVSQWLTGPGFLGVNQVISGAGVAPGTIVTALDPDPNVYWVGQKHNTGSINGFTTNKGTTFDGYVVGVILTSNGLGFTGPLLQAGDEIISPLVPPPPGNPFTGVLPGTVIGPQIDGPPGGGPNAHADFYLGVKQNVPLTTMTGVGGPIWNTSDYSYQRNVPGFCPRGVMYLNQMLIVNGDGLDLLFASKRGTTLIWKGNATATTNVGPAVKFNTLAFSTVKSLAVADSSLGGVSNYLVSLSHTPGAPGLNVENNTLHDWSISGNYATSKCGVAVSPEGGAAQGDTQLFFGCWVQGCDDGFTFGGANAIAGTFFGGQTQACPRYGVGAFGGSFSAYTMLTENETLSQVYYQVPMRSQVHLGGADFYAAQVATESCVVIGCRSEASVGMIDTSHQSSVTNWTTGGYYPGWSPNMHWTPQTLLAVNNPAVGSANALDNYTTVMLADDGGPPWILSDASTTTTVISFTPSPGWTPNQWAGCGVWILAPGVWQASNPCTIQSNTANTLTVTPGFLRAGANWYKIFRASAGAPPNWGAVTHFGQFQRNASGWGTTIAKGFNLLQSAQPLNAGDWVMLPSQGIFPDGSGIAMALAGKVQNQHPGASGWYLQSSGTTANIFGAPTNPILLGASVSGFNFLVAQTSGAAGAVGQYTLAFSQAIGADFTGSISGALLTVTAVASGVLAVGQYLGGAGLPTTPPAQIAAEGAGFTGYVDDGSAGGVTPGSILTVTAVAAGSVRPGSPLTGGKVNAGSVILSQISGPPGGAGTYNVSGSAQLSGHCAFTGSMNTSQQLNVTAITSGALVPGQLIQGAGVPANIILGAQLSGATGGIGLYNYSAAVTVASEAMTAAWPLSGGGLAAAFTATVDDGHGAVGAVLTVTAMASGVLGVGQTVNVPVTGGPAGLTAQATIVPSLTSTGTGGVGTYALSGLGNLLVASQTMSANTTGGVGVYVINQTLGAIPSEEMQAGVASITQPLWEIVDNYGNPQNAATYAIDGFGYWSAGIADGGLTHMVIDFDVFWGVGALDQCQLGGYGKVGLISRMDNPYAVPGGIQGQGIRPGEGAPGSFSYKSGAQYTQPPRFGVTAASTPFTIGITYLGQSNVYCTVSANNTVLGLVPLGAGLIVDIDLFLTPGSTIAGGMIVQWDPTTVKAPTPTINIGQGGQQTVVRLKWVGNASAAAPGGHWWVMSTGGPM